MLGRTAMVAVTLAILVAACAGEAVTPTVPQLDDLPGASLPPGEPAPDFSVETFDGGTFTLSQRLAEDGKPVFLNLWASWCAPCRSEMPDIDGAAGRHPEVTFLGVAVQDASGASMAFADEIGVGYPLGFDASGEVDAGYTPIGLPATFIISPDGRVVERVFGPLTGDEIDDKLAKLFG
jgi:cytochrome c biogenesis protein CcmG, thiol:disulfide interchange protein DsbE